MAAIASGQTPFRKPDSVSFAGFASDGVTTSIRHEARAGNRFGGYADYITHGHDGLLFDGQQQALELLREVRRNVDLRQRVGAEARRTVERMYSREAGRRRIEELLC